MIVFWIIMGAVLFFLIATLVISYYCFHEAFYANRKQITNPDEYDIPPGKIYEPFRNTMITWMKEVRNMNPEEFSVVSFDGLTLRGKFYEYSPGAPIELMFHGYRGNAERDLCGGVQRCFALGRSTLIVDQRASGKSEGNVITFGVNESKDCLTWIDFMIKHFGDDVKIIITGISMGAATVMCATGYELPKNVIGALADCGYTSAKDIIKKVIRTEMNLPENLAYPFVKLGGRIFGRFNIDETSPIDAIKRCKVPIIFIHGESDDYVPCRMSQEVYDACNSKKAIVTFPGAGHGLSYLVDPEKYLNSLIDFAVDNNIPIADSNHI